MNNLRLLHNSRVFSLPLENTFLKDFAHFRINKGRNVKQRSEVKCEMILECSYDVKVTIHRYPFLNVASTNKQAES